KIIAIILLVNLGFTLGNKKQKSEQVAQEIRDIVNKYKRFSTGNAELYQWVEKLYSKINTRLEIKEEYLSKFKEYDRRRQSLENQ
ncbi:hypothetical protein M5D96_004951, partial [Drosophila gunungcola]